MLWQKLIGASIPPTVTFIGTTTSTANATTYTFNTVNIGGPGLIVVVAQASADTNRILSSLTVGGTAATIHSNTASRDWAFIASHRVVSGTTANIVVTFSGSAIRCLIAVYRIENNVSDTPVQVLTNYSSSDVTSRSLPFTASGTAVGVFGATSGNGSGTFTWSNATEQFDTPLESGSLMTGATRDSSTVAGTVTVTCTASNRLYLSGAFWR